MGYENPIVAKLAGAIITKSAVPASVSLLKAGVLKGYITVEHLGAYESIDFSSPMTEVVISKTHTDLLLSKQHFANITKTNITRGDEEWVKMGERSLELEKSKGVVAYCETEISSQVAPIEGKLESREPKIAPVEKKPSFIDRMKDKCPEERLSTAATIIRDVATVGGGFYFAVNGGISAISDIDPNLVATTVKSTMDLLSGCGIEGADITEVNTTVSRRVVTLIFTAKNQAVLGYIVIGPYL